MAYDPRTHHRRSIRLPRFDYSSDANYFITICTNARQCLFGHVDADAMHLNAAGEMVDRLVRSLEARFPGVTVTIHRVMPNHVHLLLQFRQVEFQVHPPRTVGDVVGWLKSMACRGYASLVREGRAPRYERHLWQRDYWEHVVRNEAEWEEIYLYILTNPAKWAADRLNPAYVSES